MALARDTLHGRAMISAAAVTTKWPEAGSQEAKAPAAAGSLPRALIYNVPLREERV